MIAALLVAAATTAGGPPVLLNRLTSFGSSEESRAAVESVFAAELQKVLSDEVLTANDIDERPELASKLNECEGRVECLLRVAAETGVRGIIVGNISGLGDDRVVNLRYLDPERRGPPRARSASLTGAESELIPTMRALAVQLVAPEKYLGTVELRIAEAGIDLKIDGLSVGESPLADNNLRLPVGTHAVEATAPGRVPMSAIIDVRYDEIVPVTVDLPTSDIMMGGATPFRHRWWTWTVAGVGITTLAVGAVFNVLHVQAAERINNDYAAGILTAADRGLYEQEQLSWNVALISYVVGSVLLGVTASLLTWDFISPDG